MLLPSGEFQNLEDDAGGLYDRPGVECFCGDDGRLRWPSGLAFDGQGYLYVTSFIAMVRTLLAASNLYLSRQLQTVSS